MSGTDDKALRDAYLDTIYRVNAEPQPIDIRIGERNAALDELMRANSAVEWAFVTASNPHSRVLSEHDNTQRNTELKRSLEQAGWPTLDGVGLPCKADWQGEQSVLILGIDRDAAIALARYWEQNAIVYGVAGSPAELVWLT